MYPTKESLTMSDFETKALGDNDDDVKRYQGMLRRVGYSVEVTGTYCKRFEKSVKIFQGDLQLPTTGRIDLPTYQKLERCYMNRS
jgi:peptidoglycan hydrolase-like protein with peptidoglycan-binding domain